MRDNLIKEFSGFLLAIFMTFVMCGITEAKEESKWVEQQCIDLPKGIVVHEGLTANGNLKYWFEFDKIGKVSISPSSAEKYRDDEVVLQLVKWRHKETGEYKYSVRQKKDSKKNETLNIDLLTFFK